MIRFTLILILATRGLLTAEVVEERIEHAGVKFRVVRVAPKQVRVFWKDARGEPYHSFDRVQAAVAKEGKSVKFIMNAGIFQEGGIPCGLHVENGKMLRPINLADAPGNFYLKPNGVCTLGKDGVPFVGTCPAWQARGVDKDTWAVQSGPMLLIDGKRHPAFKNGSANKLERNGVGVDDKKRLVFAITAKDEVVNFWDFAGLFLSLGCKDALFLDGTISQMATNPAGLLESRQFGAMLVVAE